MPHAAHARSIYRFGVYLVDLQKGELLKHGARVRIQDKPFQVLAILLEKAGEVVNREELQQRLWPANTFVEFDDGLNAAVKKLRIALNDSADHPKFVATAPRRGYRFIAPLMPVSDENETRSGVEATEVALQPATIVYDNVTSATNVTPKPEIRGRLLVVGSLVVVMLAAALALFWKYDALKKLFSAHAGHASETPILPITSLPGEERMPVLSPEGGRAVFFWEAPEKDQSGIYAVIVGSQSLVRLTKNRGDAWPAWSADGRFVAFERWSGRKLSIDIVPALGGPERILYSGEHTPWTGPEGLSFSPDGKLLAFAEWTPETQQSSIKLISLDGSGIRTLTSPPPAFRDAAPTFSPSGDSIAFVRSTGPIFVDEIFVVPITGGAPTQVTFDRRRMFSPPVWTKDGKELLFASSRAGIKSLWRIPVTGGTPKPIPGVGPGADHPTFSPATGELAYEYAVQDENLWRIELRNNVSTAPPRALLAPRTHNLMPQFSPDGTKIAFESDRSGYEEIWICNSDGTNSVQVTHQERYAGSPRWSPDGRYLAFDFRAGEHTQIYVVELAKGSPRPLVVSADADNVIPSWSRDGRWIYFASNRGSKDFHVWKVAANGGTPVQLTRDSGFVAFESSDARSVFYARLTQPGIWKVPAEGGPEELVCECTQPDDWAEWTVAENGLYFIDTKSATLPQIKFMDFESGNISLVSKMEKPVFVGMTLSPDGKSIIYSQRDRDEHDILMTKLP